MCAERAVPPWPGEDHVCAECGFSYPRCSPAEAADVVLGLAEGVGAAIEGVPSAILHERPAEGGWSVTEYVCHLRDVCMLSTLRAHRTRTELRPVLEPMLNDVRAARFRYNEYALEPVLRELGLVASALHNEILDTGCDEWERVAVREVQGTREERSLAWVVRNAAHEAVHHLQDVRRLVGVVA